MSDEGEQQPPERPDYKVYRSGGGEGERREPPKKKPEKRDKPEAKEPEPKEPEAKEPAPKEPKEPRKPERPKTTERRKPERPAGAKPEYKVYRSRPGVFDRFRKPDLASLRRGGGRGLRDRIPSLRGGERRWLWWVLIAIGGWLLISFISFAVSAQIQKGDLSDEAKDALAGGPDVLAGQNILILGGDQRGEKVSEQEPGVEKNAPPRADSIMVLHAGLTSFRKLSIPRDTLAEIPGFGTEKINAAFSITGFRNGDAALMIRTVEDFLGIDINHIIIVDFDGFVDFIDSLGGITVDLKKKVCGEVSGGKENGGVTIKLKAGEHTLQSQKALALSRIRQNTCNPSEDDRDRAERQQLILNGIKGRLTSPTRAPINFIKGPWIGWAAPKAFISDMGGATLPQVAMAAFFGGGGETNVLEPSSSSGTALVVDSSECERAVKKLTGGAPDEEPACSPG